MSLEKLCICAALKVEHKIGVKGKRIDGGQKEDGAGMGRGSPPLVPLAREYTAELIFMQMPMTETAIWGSLSTPANSTITSNAHHSQQIIPAARALTVSASEKQQTGWLTTLYRQLSRRKSGAWVNHG